MNKKLKIALKNHSSDQGFAIPIAVGMGLTMILIATTLIVRSQGDQVSASAQKATAQSLAVAEGGMTRTLFKLNQSSPNVSSLMKRTYDPIDSSTGKTFLGLDGKANSGDELTVAVNEWTAANMPPCTTTSDLLNGTIGNSPYKVLAYRYDAATKIGTLLVKGQISTGNSSEARVQQTFTVSSKVGSLVGVLGTDDIDLGNNDIRGTNGNVACTNTTKCPVPSGSCSSLTNISTNSVARDAIGAGPQADIGGKIFLGPLTTPSLPTMPTVWNGSGTAPTTAFTISNSGSPFDYIDNNTTLVFPRSSDFTSHVAGTPYNYSINNINANGFNITINTQMDSPGTPLANRRNPTGDPVYFWVSGNINMGGSSQLNHTTSSTNPTAFRIYGTSTTSQDFTVASGASNVDAFIFAPNARVGINGTGTIDGLVYAKSFGEVGANGNAVVNVPNNVNLGSSLGDLAVYFSNQTDSINSWQRQAVP